MNNAINTMVATAIADELYGPQRQLFSAYEASVAVLKDLGAPEERAREIVDEAIKKNAAAIKDDWDKSGCQKSIGVSAKRRCAETKSIMDMLFGGF